MRIVKSQANAGWYTIAIAQQRNSVLKTAIIRQR